MLSLQAIEAKIKNFDDRMWVKIEIALTASHKKSGREDGLSEEECQKEIMEAINEQRQLFEKLKERRHILYQIYFTLKVKYGNDLAKLAEELLPAVMRDRIEQQELEDIRAAISNMLEQPILPRPSSIREFLEPILWNYADTKTKERMLQELERRIALDEQSAGAERQQKEEEKKLREAAEQRAEAATQRADTEEQTQLLLQKQIFELRQQLQELQTKTSQKFVAQPSQESPEKHAELSPVSSSGGGSVQHSPQQHGVVPVSPVITKSFDMGSTGTKMQLSEEQEQCAPPAKRQCLRPLQDSQP